MSNDNSVKFLNQEEAIEIDKELMSDKYGFSTDQLMELAGLSSAAAILERFPPSSHHRVLVIAGPGNNGGDGLVAARHLFHFGYAVSVLYPKRTDKPLYKNLTRQMETLEIPLMDKFPDHHETHFDLIVDAIFGYSFKGDIRAPFDTIIKELKTTKVPIASIDIPSGWDVEKGNTSGFGFEPALLVSLTAPKLCAKDFKGAHFLGGRFVPPSMNKSFKMNIPTYPSSSQIINLSKI